jgi:6-phosphofructokinase 1
MGRNCGYLALITGVICGAEIIIIPEDEIPLEAIAPEIEAAYSRGKTHAIIVMAEGASYDPDAIQKSLEEADVGFETRVTILGHIVRGGSPSAFDRLLATRMGVAAIEALMEGKSGVMTGLRGREIVLREIDEVTSKTREPNLKFLEIGTMLSH